MRSFFTAGGTLKLDAPSYLVRAADSDLLTALRRGDFAYVLDSRQKGKSSLMIRVRESLEAEGVRTVLLDLQLCGSNLDPEQWYGSMLLAAGQELRLEDRLLALWDEDSTAGPMKRFFNALERVTLELDGKVVVFVDEIDFVRSLPFSTDEFFAGIRESFNRRAAGAPSPLTFCLLGVATPSELIRDVQITPFNVGTRVDLTDFTLAELAPYESALSEDGRDGRALVRRIHHWTSGHPYLTQKLATAVAQDPAVKTAGGIDRLVETMFFSLKARAEEPNLADVSRRVLEAPVEGVSPEEARSRVLDLYRQVRDGKRVRDDETDPIVSVLKLSGLTRILEGYLIVRNRVYFRAFDRSWVEANLPDAEIVRQRRAARSAALRVGIVTGGVAVAIGALAIFGFSKASEAQAASARAQAFARSESQAKKEAQRASTEAAQRAEEAVKANESKTIAIQTAEAEKKKAQEEKLRADAQAEEARLANERTKSLLAQVTLQKNRADTERKKAEAAKSEADALAQKEKATADRERLARTANDKLLYQANMNLIQTAFESNQFARVQALLEESARPQYASFRGPEWGYWDHRMNTHLLSLSGHKSVVRAAAFSPDGTRIVTASDDKTVRQWDAGAGQEIVSFQIDADSVTSAEFSPDGTRIVTSSSDNTARVWDARDGREITKVVLKAGPPGTGTEYFRAFFAPDGKKIVALNGNNTAGIWDARNGREIAKLAGHSDSIKSASFSPDGTRIVTASDDKTVRVWDTGTGKERISFKSGRYSATSAEFSPDGTRIVTSSSDFAAQVWDAGTGKELVKLEGHSGSTTSAHFSPDGTRIVTSSIDGTARVWDLRTGNESAELVGHTGWVESASFSPDGSRIITVGEDRTARIWDSRDGLEIATLIGHSGDVISASFSPDGMRVATSSSDGTARVWDARIDHLAAGFTGWNFVTGARFTSKDTLLVSGDARIATWDLVAGKASNLRVMDGDSSPVRRASFSFDGTLMVTVGQEDAAELWSVKTGKRIARLKGHKEQVTSASFSNDGTLIATSSEDLTARIWDATTGKEIVRLQGHSFFVNSAEFSPDNTKVLTGSADNSVRLWDLSSGKLISKLVSYEGPIAFADFSPDGTKIVTASEGNDTSVCVWDVATSKRINRLEGHTGAVNFASFSSDGSRIISASEDNTVRMWDARNGREVLRIDFPDYLTNASISENGQLLLVTAGYRAQIIPLSREAAAELTFVTQEQFVTDELAKSAAAGDRFAWEWQKKHWLTPEIAATEEFRAALRKALESPNLDIAIEAAKRLGVAPAESVRGRYAAAVAAENWVLMSDYLRKIVADPSATMNERKELALVHLRFGETKEWAEVARGAVRALRPDSSADDVFQAAIAVRCAPGALEDYNPLILAVDKAAASNPQEYGSAASPGALLYRAGRFAEAEQRLKPSVQANSPFGQIFMAMTLSKLGRGDEAKSLFQAVDSWAKSKLSDGDTRTNLDSQTWNIRVELSFLLNEARALIEGGGLPQNLLVPKSKEPAPFNHNSFNNPFLAMLFHRLSSL